MASGDLILLKEDNFGRRVQQIIPSASVNNQVLVFNSGTASFGSVPVSGTGSFTGSYNGTFTGSFNGTFTGSFTGSMDSPLNVGSLTGAVTFNVTGGNMQYGTLTGNVTATISMNQPQQMMRLFLSASGADRTITFAAGNYALQSSYVIGSGKASVFEIQRLNSLNYIFFSDYLTQI